MEKLPRELLRKLSNMNSTSLDLIIRIKNGYMSKKKVITGTYSKLNGAILAILKKEQYITDYKQIDHNGLKMFQIELGYKNGSPMIRGVKLHSTPGKRIYKKIKELRPVLGGLGIAIITTPFGVKTDREARKAA